VHRDADGRRGHLGSLELLVFEALVSPPRRVLEERIRTVEELSNASVPDPGNLLIREVPGDPLDRRPLAGSRGET